jgi:hypothetical protein
MLLGSVGISSGVGPRVVLVSVGILGDGVSSGAGAGVVVVGVSVGSDVGARRVMHHWITHQQQSSMGSSDELDGVSLAYTLDSF